MTTKTTTDVAAPDGSAKTLTLEDVLELTGAASAEELVERFTTPDTSQILAVAADAFPAWRVREAALSFALTSHQNDRNVPPGVVVVTAKTFFDFLQGPSQPEPTLQQAA